MYDAFTKDITASVLGAKGSGKSVMLAEALNRFKKGILIDTIGVFNPKNRFKSAVVPNSTYFTSPRWFLMYARLHRKLPPKTVINLSEFVGEDLIREADKVFGYIYGHIRNTPILIDECADLVPPIGKQSKKLILLVKNGRNYGLKPLIFATQRPQSMAKSVFDLADTFYVSRQNAPRTVEYILDILDKRGEAGLNSMIRQLEPRQFIRYDGSEMTGLTVPRYKYAFKQ